VSVSGVGCLLLAPPSVAFDTPYPFNRTFLPIALRGLSGREPWGRWNQSTTAHMTFSADGQRAPIYRDAFVNLQVAPHQLPGLASRRLLLSWGAGRDAETRLAGREWLSLPLQPGDWAGGPKLFTLDVSVKMPDAVPPRSVDPQSPESRPIAVSSGRSRSARRLADACSCQRAGLAAERPTGDDLGSCRSGISERQPAPVGAVPPRRGAGAPRRPGAPARRRGRRRRRPLLRLIFARARPGRDLRRRRALRGDRDDGRRARRARHRRPSDAGSTAS